MNSLSELVLRGVGWRALMLTGDPCVSDRWMFVRRHLRSGPCRTLDAGAGNGGFALMAADRGNEVIGLSFAQEELAIAERRAAVLNSGRITFRVGDLRQLPEFSEELGTFDQIICLEVIEHLIEDEQLIRRLAALLRPGGQLLVSSPSADHRPLFTERISETEDGGHVRWGYSPERLAEILDAAGLTIVEQGAVSGIVSQKLTNLMRRAQQVHRALGWAIVFPLRALQVFDRKLTDATRWPYLCVTAVAIRGS